MDDRERIERIQELTGVIEEIDNKCYATCPHTGTWYCNQQCLWPAMRKVAEERLREFGVSPTPRKEHNAPSFIL